MISIPSYFRKQNDFRYVKSLRDEKNQIMIYFDMINIYVDGVSTGGFCMV